jgi:leucyl aminopeptidase
LIKDISKNMLKKRLTRFTQFFNRYYTSKTGKESAQWLYERIVRTVEHQAMKNRRASTVNTTLPEITVNYFDHSWGQPSIVAHIPGSSEDPVEREKIVVLGAHLDDTGGFFGKYLRAPGADDDGKLGLSGVN